MKIIALGLALVLPLAGCGSVSKDVVAGQSFCAKATASGPIVVALADAAGVPVTVTNKTAAAVAMACAAIGAIPVSPPTNPSAAPVVAADVK